MSHLVSPRPRALRVAVACAAALGLAAVPAVASADPTAANQWSGGALAPDRLAGDSTYPTRFSMISMTTSATKARLAVRFYTPSCQATTTIEGTVTPAAGGSGDDLALGVEASGLERRFGSHLRFTVSLRPAGPGVLAGTATMRGTFRARGRTLPCNGTSPVVVRSRQSLDVPLQPFSTDHALPRVGVVSTTVDPRVKGAIAITRRADGWFHAAWTGHQACRSGPKRSGEDIVNATPRFRIRADGSFRGVETDAMRGTTRGRHEAYHLRTTIIGRIGPDGVARGTVSLRSVDRLAGYDALVCRVPSSTFEAAP